VKGQYTRSRTIYNNIVAFEKFTGNGGGDGDDDGSEDDEDDKKERYGLRLEGARKKGINTGTISANVIHQWYSKGWYDLSNSRFIFLVLQVLSFY
jgi:hypothetical protein